MVNTGATLTLDNTGTNNANRIAPGIAITLYGGTINFLGNASLPSTQTFGAITLNAGNDTITNTNAAGSSSVLTIAALTRAAGAQVNFIAQGSALGSSTNKIIVNQTINPTPTSVSNGNFLLPYAAASDSTGVNFAATVDPILGLPASTGPFSIVPFTAYQTAGLGSSSSSDVVMLTASDPLTARPRPGGRRLDQGRRHHHRQRRRQFLDLDRWARSWSARATTGDTIAAPISLGA